jgi:hypothetical protein
MQQFLDPKLVAKTRGAVSRKILEKIYHVPLFCRIRWIALRAEGWEVIVDSAKLELVAATSTFVFSIN